MLIESDKCYNQSYGRKRTGVENEEDSSGLMLTVEKVGERIDLEPAWSPFFICVGLFVSVTPGISLISKSSKYLLNKMPQEGIIGGRTNNGNNYYRQ